MIEIASSNFREYFPRIKDILEKCKFVAIDLEFSALNPFGRENTSLFDTPEERYHKLQRTFEQVIPLQIGLTPFLFNPDKNSYTGKTFTFYLFPKPFYGLDRVFVCQASSLQFLWSYNFDFNKFVCSGIPYINKTQESQLHINLKSDLYMHERLDAQLDDVLETNAGKINQWLIASKPGDSLILHEVYEKYKHNIDYLYCLRKNLHQKFKHRVWTLIENNQFIVNHVTKEDFVELQKNCNIEQEHINELLGFTQVFRLLTSLGKPIIGHNSISDLMIMYNCFESSLPKSYTEFKSLLHNVFPVVYDTKTLSFAVRNILPEKRRWTINSLESLYVFFKDGSGRHLVLNSPYIEMDVEEKNLKDQFHNAGWDSYCTGYIFIRMAHIYAMHQHPTSKEKIFMSGDLLSAVSQFKNRLNVIRASVPFIQLDGTDPVSERPAWLLAESLKDRRVNIEQLTALLSNYGRVEVKPFCKKGQKVLIAVDNFGSARRILSQVKSHSDFHIKPYNALQHSPVLKATVLVSTAGTGLLLAWLLHNLLTKK